MHQEQAFTLLLAKMGHAVCGQVLLCVESLSKELVLNSFPYAQIS